MEFNMTMGLEGHEMKDLMLYLISDVSIKIMGVDGESIFGLVARLTATSQSIQCFPHYRSRIYGGKYRWDKKCG
jgi:hypothetical protein